MFEKTAAADPALDGTQPHDVRPPVPASLLAAAADPHPAGSPVRLAVDGTEVIAVIGDEGGDPRAWWAAIRRAAGWVISAS